MADTNKCGHEACSCTVQKDDKYCSPQCEADASSDVTAIACECGHPGCAGEV